MDLKDEFKIEDFKDTSNKLESTDNKVNFFIQIYVALITALLSGLLAISITRIGNNSSDMLDPKIIMIIVAVISVFLLFFTDFLRLYVNGAMFHHKVYIKRLNNFRAHVDESFFSNDEYNKVFNKENKRGNMTYNVILFLTYISYLFLFILYSSIFILLCIVQKGFLKDIKDSLETPYYISFILGYIICFFFHRWYLIRSIKPNTNHADYKENQFTQNKILYHTKKIAKFIKIQKKEKRSRELNIKVERPKNLILPIVFELSLCGGCNNDCAYCICKRQRSSETLTKKQIKDVINQIAKISSAITITGGGEPSLCDNLEFAISYAFRKGLTVGLITNGSLLTKATIRTLVKTASFCRISIDSVDYDIANGIRKFERQILHSDALKNINSIVEQKKVSEKSELEVGIHIVWLNQRDIDIKKSISCFKDKGVDFVQIRPVDNIPGCPLQPHIDYKDKVKYLASLVKEFESYNFSVYPDYARFEEHIDETIQKKYDKCLGAYFTASIGHDNNLYFCCAHIGDKEFSLGEIKKNNLISLLNSDKRYKLIDFIDKTKCQNQCRNHNLNKLLSSFVLKPIEEQEAMVKDFSQKDKPKHYEFL